MDRGKQKPFHGRSPIPGTHGALNRDNVHEDELAHKKKKVKKKVTSSDKISPQTIRIKVSHLKNHTYIYFAFLEIVIEVHIT